MISYLCFQFAAELASFKLFVYRIFQTVILDGPFDDPADLLRLYMNLLKNNSEVFYCVLTHL